MKDLDGALAEDRTPDQAGELPLYVDLDGTLVQTDVAQEQLVAALARPRNWPPVLRAWRAHGASGIKHAVWDGDGFHPALLPYDAEVLDYLRAARAQGRRIVLATAADRQAAEAVAAHLGLFDAVLASEPGHNLKGAAKLAAIRQDCPGPFEYLGDSAADIPVWRAAHRVGFVRPDTRARTEMQAAGARLTLSTDPAAPAWRGLLRAMRPHQWAKNALVFLPLFFAHIYTDMRMLLMAALAFAAMSLMASAVYLINDLLDIPADRRHHSKRLRPFAAGVVRPVQGVAAALALMMAAVGLGFGALGLPFGLVLLLYFAMTTVYSFALKRFSTIDVIVLSLLYTVRIVAGAAACDILLSPWLLTFSLFFFVSLAYMKRFIELDAVTEDAKLPHRNYWGAELASVQAFGIANAAVSLLTLAQYINSPTALETYGARDILWLTVPLLMFWIYRTWMWAIRGKVGDDPVIFALKDRISQLTLLAVLVVLVAARHFEFIGFIR
ncbi:UbiA family prenyltransferase [Marinovum sp.]|uniref:UbiA family prenyltransferase n=1 Tax=Marinovum sp. TaxID=2024839 RepID=UPI002B2702AA|nr:UbiA family prenyltransferase [Marinovum sp.]